MGFGTNCHSIIDNYEPEDELKKEAREKLAQITKNESGTSKLKDETKKKSDFLEMEGNWYFRFK